MATRGNTSSWEVKNDALVFKNQVVIKNQDTDEGLIIEGGMTALDTYVSGTAAVNDVKITPNLSDIVVDRQIVLGAASMEYLDVADFFFDSAKASTFKAFVKVNVEPTNKNAVWELNGVYKPQGWDMNSLFTGDLTGIQFSIRTDQATGIGHITYINSNQIGTSTTIRYRATTTAQPGSAPQGIQSRIANVDGPFIPNKLLFSDTPNTITETNMDYTSTTLTVPGGVRVLAENATPFQDFSHGGSFTSLGDASVAQKMVVGESVGINTTSPRVANLDVHGDINFTGNILRKSQPFSGSSIWETNAESVFNMYGNVGVNTQNPNASLDVHGDALVTESVSTTTLRADSGNATTTKTSGTTIGSFFVATEIQFPDVSASTVQSNSVTAGSLFAQTSTIANLQTTNISSSSFHVQNATASGLVATLASVGNLNATFAESNDLVGTRSTISNLRTSAISTGSLAYVGTLNTVDATMTSLSAASAVVDNLTATDANLGSLRAQFASVGALEGSNVNLDYLGAAQVSTGSLNTAQLTVSALSTGSLSAPSSTAAIANFGTLNAGGISASNLSVTGAVSVAGVVSAQNITAAHVVSTVGIQTQTLISDDGTMSSLSAIDTILSSGSFGNTMVTNVSTSNIYATNATISSVSTPDARFVNVQLADAFFRSSNGSLEISNTEGARVILQPNAFNIEEGSLKVSDDVSIGGLMSVDGNVGIGTTSPHSKMTVAKQTAISEDSNLEDYSVSITGTSGTVSLSLDAGETSAVISHEQGILDFATDSQVRMTIDSAGNVGIGTTAPNAALSVAGALNAESVSSSISTVGSMSISNGFTSGSIIPALTDTYDLGSPSHRFRELYLSTSSFYLADKKFSVSTDGNFTIPTSVVLGGNVTGGNFTINNLSLDNVAEKTKLSTNEQEVTVRSWTTRNIPDGEWNSVVWSPELEVFVAVGAANVMTSPNGVTWTTRISPASTWNSVAWSSERGLFVAVSSNAIMTSDDAVTWATRVSPANNVQNVTWSSGPGTFVATSPQGLVTSTDGISWTTKALPVSSNSVTWNPDSQLFSASGIQGGFSYKAVAGYHNEDVAYVASQPALETGVLTASDLSSLQPPVETNFSYEFTGYFIPPMTGDYNFSTNSDDGSYLWVGDTAVSGYNTGNALVNNGGQHGPQTRDGIVTLTQGQSYFVRILFGQSGSGWAFNVNVTHQELGEVSYTIYDGYGGQDLSITQTASVVASDTLSRADGLSVPTPTPPASVSVHVDVSHLQYYEWEGFYYDNITGDIYYSKTDYVATVNGLTQSGSNWYNATTDTTYSSSASYVAELYGLTVQGPSSFIDPATLNSYSDPTQFVPPQQEMSYTYEFTSTFTAAMTGTYTFRVTANSFAYVWLGSVATSGYTINNTLLSSSSNQQNTNTIQLTAGQSYAVRVLHGMSPDSYNLSFSYTAPNPSALNAISGFSHDTVLLTSSDAITWTTRISNKDATSISNSTKLGRYAAIEKGTGRVVTSSDGTSWTTVSSSSSFSKVKWVPELDSFVAVGSSVLTSADGIVWTTSATGNVPWQDVEYAPELGIFVAVADSAMVLTTATPVLPQLQNTSNVYARGANIGVGTKNPTETLTVAGELKSASATVTNAATASSLSASSVTSANVLGSTLTVGSIVSSTASVDNMFATNLTASNASTSVVTASNLTVDTLSSVNVVTQSIHLDVNVPSLSSTYVASDQVTVGNTSNPSLTAGSLRSGSAIIYDVSATGITSGGVVTNSANIAGEIRQGGVNVDFPASVGFTQTAGNVLYTAGNLSIGTNKLTTSEIDQGLQTWSTRQTGVNNFNSVAWSPSLRRFVAVGSREVVQAYPPAPMTSNITTITGQPHGNGRYVASASSVLSTWAAFKAFDKQFTSGETVWISNPNYNASTGVYTGGVTTTATLNGVSTILAGEWLDLELPTAQAINRVRLSTRPGFPSRTPRVFYIIGSNGNSAWDVLYNGNDMSSIETRFFYFTNTTAYITYRIVVNRLGNQDSGMTDADYLQLDVEYFSVAPNVMTSSDGVTWTERTGVPGKWNNVVWAPEQNQFVAVGSKPTKLAYPPAALTSNATAITGQLYGDGTYVASASSAFTDTGTPWTAWYAFDKGTSATQQTWSSAVSYNTAGNLLYNPLVLDNLSATGRNAARGMFALCRLSSTYTGATIKLRRGTDNVEQDFYANASGVFGTALDGTGTNVLDWLTTETASNATAFVTTWYDQSGAGRHATQTTASAQPVFNPTSLMVDFLNDGARFLNIPSGTLPVGTLNANYTIAFRHGLINNTSNGGFIGSGATNTNQANNVRYASGYNNYWWNNDVTFGASTLHPGNRVTITYDGSTRRGFVNSASFLSSASSGYTNAAGQQYIGRTTQNEYLNGQLNYMYIFGEALSDADRMLCEQTGTMTIASSNGARAAYTGEWLQLQLPTPAMFNAIRVIGRPTFEATRMPRVFYIVGSNDSFNWNVLYSGNDTTSSSAVREYTYPNTSAYMYYRLIVNSIGSSETTGTTVDVDVEYFHTTTNVMTSPDGITWTERDPVYADLNKVAWALERSLFVTAGTQELIPYPPAAMVADTTSMSGLQHGNGTYIASASSTLDNNWVAYRAFDYRNAVTPTSWHSAYRYNTSTGVYTGAVSTTALVDGVSTALSGEWLQLQFPSAVAITTMLIQPRRDSSDGIQQMPRIFYVLGSNDGSNWTVVYSGNETTSAWVDRMYSFTNTTAYSYYRLVVNRVGHADSGMNIAVAPLIDIVYYTSSPGNVYTSSDAGTWTTRQTPTSHNFTDVLWSPDQSKFVALGSNTGFSLVKVAGYSDADVMFTAGKPVLESGFVNEINLSGNSSETNISYEYFGRFVPTVSGTYSFNLNSDDQSYMWIGPNAEYGYRTSNAFLATNYGNTSGVSGNITMIAGQAYPIRVLIGEGGGGWRVRLQYSGPGISTTTVFPMNSVVLTSTDGTTWTTQTAPDSYWTDVVYSRELNLYTAVAAAANPRVYPPAAMTASSETISSQAYGNGTYVVSASTNAGNDWLPRLAFDKNAATSWASASIYSGSTGIYNGSVSTTASGQSFLGEWIQLQFPVATRVTSFQIMPRSDILQRIPRSYALVASNDGTDWLLLQEDPFVTTWNTDVQLAKKFPVNNQNSYMYYRLIVRRVGNGSATSGLEHANFSALDFFDNETSTIATSVDGATWTTRHSPNANALTSVAWSPELRVFAATALSRGIDKLVTSTDGVLWTTRSVGNGTWRDITWVSELGIFAAVSSSRAMTTTTLVPAGRKTAGRINNVSLVELNTKTLASNAESIESVSSWVARGTSNNAMNDVAWAPELGVFVAVGPQATSSLAFPPAAMSSNTTTFSGQSYGNGTYKASASTIHSAPWDAFKAFDKTTTNETWHSADSTYNASTGEYVGTVSTTAVLSGASTVLTGEWLQLQLPSSQAFTNIRITTRPGVANRNPRIFHVLGSNDGTTWQVVYSGNNMSSLETRYFGFVNGTPFLFYRLVVNRVGNLDSGMSGAVSVNIDVEYFATPQNIVRSTDGVNWTDIQGVSGDFKSVTWSPELNLFVAVGSKSLRRVYPPAAMSSDSSFISGQLYGNGAYIASASSVLTDGSGTWSAWRAFDYTSTAPSSWHAGPYPIYNRTTGIYEGAVTTSAVLNGSSTTLSGEWLQLQLPSPVAFGSILLRPRRDWSGARDQLPRLFYILGSNNGAAWNVLYSGNESNFALGNRFHAFPNTTTYLYYRIVSTRVGYQDSGMAEAGASSFDIEYYETTSNIITSPDGVTWTPSNAVYADLNKVVWSPELSLFAAAGSQQFIPYPPAGMVDDTTTFTGLPYGNGTYVASAGSFFNSTFTDRPCFAFDKNLLTYWHSSVISYNTAGAYTGSTVTTATLGGVSGNYAGEWLQLQLPSAVAFTRAKISPSFHYSGALERSPRVFYILGSNNGSSWQVLYIGNDLNNNYSERDYYFVNSTAYSYYRIVINRTGYQDSGLNNSGLVHFNLEFYASAPGNVLTSPDGITWTTRETSVPTSELTSVAWAPEQAKFAAMGNTSSFRFIKVAGYHNENPYYTIGKPVIESGIVNEINIQGNGNQGVFTYEYTGKFVPTVSGTYTFNLNSDDGSYMWIGRSAEVGYTITNAFINNGGSHGMLTRSTSISLTAGQAYPIRILFGDGGSGWGLIFSYSGPGISTTRIFPAASAALTSTNGTSWTAPVTSTVAPYIRCPFDGTKDDILGNVSVTQVGSPTFTTGLSGEAAYFPNTVSSATAPTNYYLVPYTQQLPLTISFWFNPTTLNYQTVVGLTDYAFNGLGIQFDIDNTTNRLVILSALPTAFNAVVATPPNSVAANTWHHVVLTISSTFGVAGYLNGMLFGTGAGTGPIPVTQNVFRVGGSGDTGRGFQGTIDEFRVYNRVLNAQDVAALYNNPTTTDVGSVLQPLNNEGVWNDVKFSRELGLYAAVGTVTTPKVYPPSGMFANTSTFSGLAYGNGTYIASASTNYENSYPPFWAFDKNDNTSWLSTNTYNISTGTYAGSVTTFASGQTLLGEWLQLQLPNPIRATSFQITSFNGLMRTPLSYVLVGSNDGSNWTIIQDEPFVNSWNSNNQFTKKIRFNNNASYTFYRLVIRRVGDGSTTNSLSVPSISLDFFEDETASVVTSHDGITWMTRNTGVHNNLKAIEWSSDLNAFGAVGSLPATLVVPPAAMTGNTTTLGTDTYIASASSVYTPSPGWEPFKAFDKQTSSDPTVWHTEIRYNDTTGLYTGAVTTTASFNGVATPLSGEWLQLQLPAPVPITGMKITARGGQNETLPRIFYVMGSNNGSTWNVVYSGNDTSLSIVRNYTFPNTTSYLYYRLVINRTGVYDTSNSYAGTVQMDLEYYSSQQTIVTSTDGVTWTTRGASPNDWQGLTYAPELGVFAAVGSASNTFGNVMLSKVVMSKSANTIQRLGDALIPPISALTGISASNVMATHVTSGSVVLTSLTTSNLSVLGMTTGTLQVSSRLTSTNASANSVTAANVLTTGMQFPSNDVLQFGIGYNQQGDAGKIRYKGFGNNLSIVGAAPSGVNRKTTFYDKLGVGMSPTYPLDITGSLAQSHTGRYFIAGPPQPMSTPVLDRLSSTGRSAARGAYALVRLSSSYTGPTIRLRRSTDSVEQDFYANAAGSLGTELDGTGTSVTSWQSTATAFVRTWYDQSGTGNHATQTTTSAQPVLRVNAVYKTRYKYLRWQIIRTSQQNAIVQASEFKLYLNNSEINISNAVVTNPGGTSYPDQGPEKLVDNNLSTKWLDLNGGPSYAPVIFEFPSAVAFDKYSWSTAEDGQGDRDPNAWTLEGSNNNSDWTLLSTVTDYTPVDGLARFTVQPAFSVATGDNFVTITDSQIDFQNDSARFLNIPSNTVPVGVLNAPYTFVLKHGGVNNTWVGGIIGSSNNNLNLIQRDSRAYLNWGSGYSSHYFGSTSHINRDNIVSLKYNGANRTGYINGTPFTEEAFSSFTNTAGQQYIGRDVDSNFLNGQLHFVYIFGDALAEMDRVTCEGTGATTYEQAIYNHNWRTRTSAVDNSWLSVCWAPELSLFVAVSDTGSGNRVMTSPNGTNWTSRSSAADNGWHSVVWAKELSLFVAVAYSGSGNRVMTSPNGINWTTRASAADNQWISVCWAPELSLFVAVSQSGSGNHVMTSSNGTNWTTRASAADNTWYSVCWSPQLSLFVAVSYSGSGNRVMTSPNGIDWTTRASAADNQWLSVCWAPELSLFAAVANTGSGNRVMTSPNGITWITRASAADIDWRSVIWVPEVSLFVAVALGNQLMTSSNGIDWTARASAANNQWLSVCWAPELYMFAAVSNTGSGNRVMTSTPDVNPMSSGTFDISLNIVDGYMVSTGFYSSSDERIKRDFTDINDTLALDTIRKLQVKEYKYIDIANRGNEAVVGFMAQEVENALPNAVEIQSDILPNVYCLAHVTNTSEMPLEVEPAQEQPEEQPLEEPQPDEETPLEEPQPDEETPLEEPQPDEEQPAEEPAQEQPEEVALPPYSQPPGSLLTLQSGTTDILVIGSKLKVYLEDGTSKDITVQAIVDETSFQCVEVLEVDTVFVYGQYVDDFRVLNKDAIFTTGVAALQEVDRQLQAKAQDTADLSDLSVQIANKIAELQDQVSSREN